MKKLFTSLIVFFLTSLILLLNTNLSIVNAASNPPATPFKKMNTKQAQQYFAEHHHGALMAGNVNNSNNSGVKNSSFGNPSGTPPLIYEGGEVVHSPKVYLIFWEPSHLQDGTSVSIDSTYNSTIEQFYQDLASSSGVDPYNIVTQYYDNINGHIASTPTYGGAFVVTTAYPASGCSDPETPNDCLSEAQQETEIESVAASNNITPTMNTEFILFTTSGEGTSFTNASGQTSYAYDPYCGYHDAVSYSSSPYIFANVPYSGTVTSSLGYEGCNFISNDGLSSPTTTVTDSAISTSSHEFFEMTTNPDPEAHLSTGLAWVSYDGQNEMADLCNQVLSNPLPKDSGKADVNINGHYYVVQKEYSDFIKDDGTYTGCTLSSSGEALTQTMYTADGNDVNAISTSDGGAANSAPRWTYNCTTCNFNQPAFDSVNGYVYSLDTTNNKIIQLNAVSGTNTGVNFPSNGSNIGYFQYVPGGTTAPIINSTSGTIYVSTSSGLTGTQGVYAFKKTGAEVWKNTNLTNAVTLYAFDSSSGTLYGSDGTHIYAFANGGQGALKWTYTIPNGTTLNTPDMTLSNGVLYFSAFDGTTNYYLYALNVSTPTLNWERTWTNGFNLWYSPAADSNGVYLTANDGNSGYDYLYGLSLTDGSNLWSAVQMNYSSYSKVAISGTELYAAEKGVEAVNKSTGSLDWQSSNGLAFSLPRPVVLDSVLFTDGYRAIDALYAYNTVSGPYQGDIRYSTFGGDAEGYILPTSNGL